MEEGAVPKFSSFKSKLDNRPKISEDHEALPLRKSDNHDRLASRRDLNCKEEATDRHYSYRTVHDHTRRRHHILKNGDKRLPAMAPDGFEEPDLFIIDRRGDAKNAEYGSLHKYSIPLYHQSGVGCMVGIPTSIKIDRDASSEKEVVLMTKRQHKHRKDLRSPFSTLVQGRAHNKRSRFVTPRPLDPMDDSTHSDYIDLRPPKKYRPMLGSPQNDADHLHGPDYRSIEGRATPAVGLEDNGLTFASDSSVDHEGDVDFQIRKKNAQLSRQAKAEPYQLGPWLSLIEHQAQLVNPGIETSSFSVSARRTLADLRLAILDQAATHISVGNPSRERLLLAILEEGAFIWDRKKLTVKWTETLAECASSLLLCTRYLDFIQDYDSPFKFEHCKDAYTQCLEVIQTALKNSAPDMRQPIQNIQIHVLVRFTSFLRDSGYCELAIATWQAVLEYNLLRPGRLDHATTEERLDSFEEFWESEVSRIGEDHCQGWKAYDSGHSKVRRNPVRRPAPSLDNSSTIASFVEQEARFVSFLLPTTVDDDDATLDPFRCVIFSDVKDVLAKFHYSGTVVALLDGFLCYMGLPSLPGDRGSEGRHWRQDSRVASNTAASPMDAALRLSYAAAPLKLVYRLETSDSLLFDAFGGLPADVAGFVDKLLDIVLSISPHNPTIEGFTLAFRNKAFPQEAAKVAKQMLRFSPSNLRLYNAYALSEAYGGNWKKAVSVWAAALDMQHKLDPENGEDGILLRHSQLLLQARRGDSVGALESILRALNDASDDTHAELRIQTLKASKELEEGLDRALLRRMYQHAASYADILAWLTYLSRGHDLDAALLVYQKHAKRMIRYSASFSLELLYQNKVNLLRVHLEQRRPYKPATFRKELENDLNHFPSNSVILDLHLSIVAQDRLRSLLREKQATDLSQMTVVQWSYKLAEELSRVQAEEASGSTANSVRATFAKALLAPDSKVQHSPHLWISWLRFEHDRKDLYSGETERAAIVQRVRKVFLDGLRYLPWHKPWAMMGMRFLAEGGMTKAEMKQVYETMVERGLRITVDIDDLL